MLNFNPQWRLQPPMNDGLHHGEIPGEAVEEFIQLIRAIALGERRKATWEHFKRRFSGPARREFWASTNSDYAEQDGAEYIRSSAQNPLIFIEAFYDAWTELSQQHPQQIPEIVEPINSIFARFGIGYRLAPPYLEVVGQPPPLLLVALPEVTIEESARDVIRTSLDRAANLLGQGEDRAAVMESLWLLDSVTTVFSGLDLPNGRIDGVYFTTIARDLRRLNVAGPFSHAIRWMESMYGYLSSPGGGQIRHGMNLSDELHLNRNEARLYCNLIRSYVEYLLGEHERLTRR